MKKYYSLGELLTDFREKNNQTQSDLAAALDVDVRTVARWENNESLIKANKVEDVVETTFIPYQVIHNLNAAVPLPIYYDFRIRKYSLTAIEKDMPDAEWYHTRLEAVSHRVKPITNNDEIDYIVKYHRFLYPTEKPVGKSLISHAAKVLPELNIIIYDNAGFYAGHRVVFPVSLATFQKLKNREMVEGELRPTQLTNYKTTQPPVFYGYSGYADCNENVYYLVASLIRFIKNQCGDNYIYGALVVRYDVLDLLPKIGAKKIWEDKEEQKKLGMLSPPTFFEARFNDVFLGKS